VLRLVLSLAVLAASAATAAAQGAVPPVSPALQRYIAGPSHRSAVIAMAKRIHEALPTRCGTVDYRPTGQVRIERPVSFDAYGRPLAGMWSEVVNVVGCDRTRRYNVLTMVPPDGAPQLAGLLSGTTRTDLLLQRRATAYALGAASLRDKTCKHLAVLDTRFVAFEAASPATPKRPWREVWTVWACGKHFTVPLDFSPKANGTTVSAERAQPAPG
jgi:hypothetical protein